MARLVYKLWLSGEVVGEWSDPHAMREGVRGYIEAHPDELQLLNLGTFTQSRRRGTSPASTISGNDILTFLEDIEAAEE